MVRNWDKYEMDKVKMFLEDTLKVFAEAHDNEKALVSSSKQWEHHILHLSQLRKMIKKIQIWEKGPLQNNIC